MGRHEQLAADHAREAKDDHDSASGSRDSAAGFVTKAKKLEKGGHDSTGQRLVAADDYDQAAELEGSAAREEEEAAYQSSLAGREADEAKHLFDAAKSWTKSGDDYTKAAKNSRKAGQKKDAKTSAKKAHDAYEHARELRKEWADRVAYLGRRARRRKEFAKAGELLAAAAKAYDEAEALSRALGDPPAVTAAIHAHGTELHEAAADAYDQEGDTDAADRESALADKAKRE